MKSSKQDPVVTEARFLSDIATHQLEIIKDDGLYRHLRFKQPDSINMYFDLVTWPGHLSYSGDMGSYTFTRLRDMFEFFRTDQDSERLKSKGLTLGINPSYWAEKLQSVDKNSGYEEFDEERFEEIIKGRVLSWCRENKDRTTKEERRELWGEVMDQVLSLEDNYTGQRRTGAAYDFHHTVNRNLNFYFEDLFDSRLQRYTLRFLWCCYALAWGIKLYDETKAKAVCT